MGLLLLNPDIDILLKAVKIQISLLLEEPSDQDLGAWWLSGRVFDSRPKGRVFEPHRRHCLVSLSKTH